ncbi:MAG: type IX secretion system outer membrane channel protein PorV [Bergeyella sp.]|nr:type IX secretion system outer membrane channel protein PorV [Bergeyella sp.]
MNFKSKLLAALILGIGTNGFTQLSDIRPVLTGAPFLRISPDARSGGMADQGVATSPDVFSQFWNAAKYPFNHNTSSVGVSYTPYMNKLTNDVFLLYGSYFQFLGDEGRSTISTSIYYFSMGEVDLTQLVGNQITSNGAVKPNEFSFDAAYALKLTDRYSMAVAGRYIRSDFGSFGSDSTLKPANSFAVDVSGYYKSEKFRSFGDYQGRINAGWAIQNLGPKLDYTGDDESRSYLPTIARLGVGYDLFIDEQNRLSLSVEATKLLVPGSEITGYENGRPINKVPNVGVMQGIGKSFNNKKSIMFSSALEYSFDDVFALRGGYFRESPEQGGRQFATAGIGFNYQSFGLDISYLVNTSRINTTLDNTLRFGLTWNIGEKY